MNNDQLDLFGDTLGVEIIVKKTASQKFRQAYGIKVGKHCGDCARFVNSKCSLKGNARVYPNEIACDKFVGKEK